jgi:E3 ubiquitin-protein ligase HUWE1
MGEKKVKELVENGSEVYVQESNKKEYVEKLIDFVMIQQIKSQTQAFLEGFFSIFPKSELDVIDWMELGSKIAGAQEIDSTLSSEY